MWVWINDKAAVRRDAYGHIEVCAAGKAYEVRASPRQSPLPSKPPVGQSHLDYDVLKRCATQEEALAALREIVGEG